MEETLEQDIVQKPKKPRSEKQQEAFKVAQDKRNANAKIKREQIAIIKEKAKKMELINEYAEPTTEPTAEPKEIKEEKERVTIVKVPKKKPKIIYQEESSSDEEVVIVKRKKERVIEKMEQIPIRPTPLYKFL